MKLLGSLLFASAAKAATLCTSTGHTNAEFVNSLIVPSCDHEKFTLDIDETCRGAEYNFIDWSSTFVDGVVGTVQMPSSLTTGCGADGSGSAWKFETKFTECNIAAPVDVVDTATGITYLTYTMYLNFDNAIAAAQGTGNLQQLGQTKITCRVPKNLQENALTGKITIQDSDPIPDVTKDIKLWEFLQLDVYSGGMAGTASWAGTALTTGATINLGENVKLKIDNTASNTVLSNYEVAIKDCWASTIENRLAANTDTGAVLFDAAGTNGDGANTAHKTVKFWEGQCPKYNWVGPDLAGNTANSNTEVTLKQFAFNDNSGTLTNDFYYHCEVDICVSGTDCTPGTGCATLTGNAPSGRKRRAIISSRRLRRSEEGTGEVTPSKKFSLDVTTCEHGTEFDGDLIVCKEEKKSSSSAETLGLGILTGALVCALH